MSNNDWAWLAGLFEGEGCINIRRRAPGRSVQLLLQSTDQDVIERVRRIAGVGRVTTREPLGIARQRAWRWGVYTKTEVIAVLRQLEPYFGRRRLAKSIEARGYLDWEAPPNRKPKSPEHCAAISRALRARA